MTGDSPGARKKPRGEAALSVCVCFLYSSSSSQGNSKNLCIRHGVHASYLKTLWIKHIYSTQKINNSANMQWNEAMNKNLQVTFASKRSRSKSDCANRPNISCKKRETGDDLIINMWAAPLPKYNNLLTGKLTVVRLHVMTIPTSKSFDFQNWFVARAEPAIERKQKISWKELVPWENPLTLSTSSTPEIK
jgi:hypothetical protein